MASAAAVKATFGRSLAEFAKDYASGLGGETVTEMMQEAVQMAGESFARSATDPRLAGMLETTAGEEEVYNRILGVAEKTLKAMVLLGLPGPAINVAIDTHRARNAGMQQKFLESLSTGAKNLDALRKEAPEEF